MSIRGILVKISILRHQSFLTASQKIIIEQIFFFVKSPCCHSSFYAKLKVSERDLSYYPQRMT